MSSLTLRDARRLLGLSQEQLAVLAGQKRSAIDDLETGRNGRPAYVLVVNVFRALQHAGLNGISIDDVFPVPAHGVNGTDGGDGVQRESLVEGSAK